MIARPKFKSVEKGAMQEMFSDKDGQSSDSEEQDKRKHRKRKGMREGARKNKKKE